MRKNALGMPSSRMAYPMCDSNGDVPVPLLQSSRQKHAEDTELSFDGPIGKGSTGEKANRKHRGRVLGVEDAADGSKETAIQRAQIGCNLCLVACDREPGSLS